MVNGHGVKAETSPHLVTVWESVRTHYFCHLFHTAGKDDERGTKEMRSIWSCWQNIGKKKAQTLVVIMWRLSNAPNANICLDLGLI
jgi:hypothetical protein